MHGSRTWLPESVGTRDDSRKVDEQLLTSGCSWHEAEWREVRILNEAHVVPYVEWTVWGWAERKGGERHAVKLFARVLENGELPR